MRNLNTTIFSASDDDSSDGVKIDSNQLISASFHAFFSDTDFAGSVKVQASNDVCAYGNVASDFTPTNWVDVPNAEAAIVDGAPALITIAQMSYRWIRVVLTQTTPGTGTAIVNINALGI